MDKKDKKDKKKNPKDKKKKDKKKEKEKKYVGADALFNESDPYGEKYKKNAKKDLRKTESVCFTCGFVMGEFIGFSLACRICDYEYCFCPPCKPNYDIFVSRMRCIFCERKRNDQIGELLLKAEIISEIPKTDGSELDLYHDDFISKLLEEKSNN